MVSLLEYAQLADKAYEPSTAREPSIPGWTCSSRYAVDDASVFSGGSVLSSGLQMRLFVKAASPEVVIAFKGTVPTMASDLLADLRIVVEGIPRQAYQAIRHTRNWKSKFKGYRVTLVGHSLGGGISQIVGLEADVKFVTFNAPGMWTNAVGVCAFSKLKNTLSAGMNYIKLGDLVGNFGKHIGNTRRVASFGHSIVGFVETIENMKEKAQDPLA